MGKARYLTSAAAAVIWLGGAPALAQDLTPSTPPPAGEQQSASTEPQTDDDAPTQGDIIVTAQKRAERLLDVPVSVAATTGEQLTRLNLANARDLQFVTPGLGLGDANTPRGAGLRVRGIGTTVFADGIEQSVGTVVDGVPLARAGQGLTDLVDIERVEVLRGPQGMLFGRNASAGLINIITRRPTEEFSFIGNASYGTDNEVRAGASIAGPIVADRLLARVTGYINRRDGFVRNLTDDRLFNGVKEYGVRGKLELRATDTLNVLLSGDWSKRDQPSGVWTVRSFGTAAENSPGTALLRNIVDPRVVAAAGPANRTTAIGGPVFNRGESYGGALEANLELGDYTLTSITGYREWRQSDGVDSDSSALRVLDINNGSNRLNQTSQELRLTSPTTGIFDFVVGLFYYDSKNVNQSNQVGRFSVALGQAQAAGINVPLAPGLVLPAAANFGRTVDTTIRVRDYAAFGQGTLNISDNLDVFAGGRLTRTKVSMEYSRIGTPGNSAFNFVLGAQFAPLAFTTSTSDTDFSWRVGAQYRFNRNANIYATVSRGYKGPGFNNLLDLSIPTGANPSDFTRVNPEIPTSYEFGFKGSFLDRRADISLAVFRTDFRDFQAQVVETPPGQAIGSFAIRNAGKLRSQGFELELNLRPIDRLNVGLGVSYNDAKYLSFTCASRPRGVPLAPNPACTSVAAGVLTTFDASGLEVPNAPRWTISQNLRYEQPLTARVRGFVQTNSYLRDRTSFILAPAGSGDRAIQPSYVLVNGSLGVELDDGRLSLSVFARNLFDTNFVTSIFDLPIDAAGGYGQFVTFEAKRTVGIAASARF